MSYSVQGTTITLTRGDTFMALISITQSDGAQYLPVEGDSIRFAMKRSYEEEEPLLVKDIPIDTMKLILEPGDTKTLMFGKYVYDIQLTKVTGEVDTFITNALETLSGSIVAEVSLSGILSCAGGLSGKVSVTKEYDDYEGEYKIIPKTFAEQVLPTSNRVLKEDVIVKEVPFYETSNDSGGITVYIGKDIENGL